MRTTDRFRSLLAPFSVAALLVAGCAAGGDDDLPDVRDVADDGGDGDADAPRDAPDGETTGPAPSLTAVSPPSGPVAGGTLVTLTGENFASGAVATFDGTPCTDLFPASARRLTCRTPPHAAAAVDVAVANPDGQSATLAGAFTYDTAAPRVDWCVLHYPPEISAAADEPAGPLYGRVYVHGVTNGAGAGAGVRGEVGVGAAGSDPATWSWGAAAFRADVDGIVPGDEAHDEHVATLVGRPEGEYSYAFRFSVDDGTTWQLCDRTGSDDGFDVDHAGALHVVAAPPPAVGWCALDRPTTVAAETGAATGTIYGRVFVAGITPGDGEGIGVSAQVGVGRAGAAPDGGAWTWTAMGYAASVDGAAGVLANDEYGAAIDAPSDAGEYLYAVRFSVDGGTTWQLCDRAGAGYSEANAGRLTATDPATGPLVGWCNVQWPSSLRAAVGTPSDPIYGRVWAEGVTPGAGRGAGIRGQVGYGTPASDPAGWTWVEADYNLDVDGIVLGDRANDEYGQTLTAATAGTYGYAYRFSMDDGRSWRLCDLDGAGGTAGDFSHDQTGTLTVE